MWTKISDMSNQPTQPTLWGDKQLSIGGTKPHRMNVLNAQVDPKVRPVVCTKPFISHQGTITCKTRTRLFISSSMNIFLQFVPKTFQVTGHSGNWPIQIYWPKPDLTGPNTWQTSYTSSWNQWMLSTNFMTTKFSQASRASGSCLPTDPTRNLLGTDVRTVLISLTVIYVLHMNHCSSCQQQENCIRVVSRFQISRGKSPSISQKKRNLSTEKGAFNTNAI